MITISLCMIVKNEEAVLGRCLDCVHEVCDEIIIVDTGSTDNTKAVAARYTDKVYDFEWINDFSAARNYSFSKATMDFQFILDADDVMKPEHVNRLRKLKQTLDAGYDIVTMRYITHMDEHGNIVHVSTRERLLKREKGYTWQDPIHECIPLIGTIFYSDIEIVHKPIHKDERTDRNINIYSALEKSGKAFTPRQLYYYARELKDHGVWDKAAITFERFLDTGLGWVEDNIATCYSLASCYEMLGKRDDVLPILLKSFIYDAPRAEICSEIGYYYKRAGNVATALQWFRLAANLGKPETLGFILQDYWGYIPSIECCVCYCELGDYVNAEIYNERAGFFKPNSPSVAHNRLYLESLKNK